MIYIDKSELKSGTKTSKNLPNKYSPLEFESFSGADIIVCRDDSPPPNNPHLLQSNLNNGAVMLQVKWYFDLTASIPDRLNYSLSKMLRYDCATSQRLLLFVGYMHEDKGEFKISGKKDYSQVKYNGALGAIRAWNERGGAYESVYAARHFALYLEQLNKRVNSRTKVKQFSKPIQELFLVNDYRVALATCEGLGKKRIDNLHNFLLTRGKGQKPSLAMVIDYIDNKEKELIKGVPLMGEHTVQKIKRWYYG